MQELEEEQAQPAELETWPATDQRPSAARIFVDHIAMPELTEDAAIEHLRHDYEAHLWPEEP